MSTYHDEPTVRARPSTNSDIAFELGAVAVLPVPRPVFAMLGCIRRFAVDVQRSLRALCERSISKTRAEFGYKVAAIRRGSENASLAQRLGASVYIDSKSTNAAEALQKLAGHR